MLDSAAIRVHSIGMTLTQIRLRLARCDLRKLAAETGVSERTLRRIRNDSEWLPMMAIVIRVQKALQRKA